MDRGLSDTEDEGTTISHNVGTTQPSCGISTANSDVNNHSRDSIISIEARLEAGRFGV